MKILLVNGPNLQLLGVREPEIYGSQTLAQIVGRVKEAAAELGAELTEFQSNSEGALVDRIGSALSEKFDGILINPAAYTHSSVAIRDALAAVALPAVEIHLTNIFSREDFRSRSLTAPVCIGVVSGFGAESYLLALRALVSELERRTKADPKH